MEIPMGQTLDSLTCSHGMPNPAACVECMAEGKFLPAAARKVRTGQAGHGGYALSNDCTVQALVNALGVEYVEAAAALRQHGWTPGQGATESQVVAAAATLGIDATRTGHTLASAAADGGTFLVVGFRGRSGHAWVIEAGQHLNALGWQRPARTRMRYTVLALG